MIFLFRVDATPAMGTGHVMRCLALAEALHDLGHRCHAGMAETVPALEARLAAEGVETHAIDGAADADAARSLDLAARLGAAAVIVDGYHFTPSWCRRLYDGARAARRRVLRFDDAADAPARDADWVLNPAARPRPDLPGCLFGPGYVPLRRDIRAAAARVRPIAERPAILVTFGGSDPAGLTLPVAAGLVAALGDAVPLDIVIGGAVPEGDRLAASIAALGAAAVPHRDARDMGGLMLRAGLAVSAAGSTLGELAALAVPAVVATVADNQVAGAAVAARDGWCVARDGRAADAAAAILRQAAALWRDPPRRAAMAARAAGLVTPDGALRIARAMLATLRESEQ